MKWNFTTSLLWWLMPFSVELIIFQMCHVSHMTWVFKCLMMKNINSPGPCLSPLCPVLVQSRSLSPPLTISRCKKSDWKWERYCFCLLCGRSHVSQCMCGHHLRRPLQSAHWPVGIIQITILVIKCVIWESNRLYCNIRSGSTKLKKPLKCRIYDNLLWVFYTFTITLAG